MRQMKTTREQREEMRTLGAVLPLGLMFGITIAFGYFGGTWVDRRFGIEPWGMIIGLLMGIGAAFVHLVKVATQLSKDEEDRARRRREHLERAIRGDDEPPEPEV
jgi:ATP synthase protein I